MPLDRDSLSIVGSYLRGALDFLYVRRQRSNTFIIDENGTILNDTSHHELIALYQQIMKTFGKDVFSDKAVERLIITAVDDDRYEILDWIFATYPGSHNTVYDTLKKSTMSHATASLLFLWFDCRSNYEIIYKAIVERTEPVLTAYIREYGHNSFTQIYNRLISQKIATFGPPARARTIAWVNDVIKNVR